ncbi:MAG: hypothetical protein U0904_10150 [Candidatus Nanopelagicales bacterium]|nr:hypothetical protein [Candidatus Nanopelagicales bacterium]
MLTKTLIAVFLVVVTGCSAVTPPEPRPVPPRADFQVRPVLSKEAQSGCGVSLTPQAVDMRVAGCDETGRVLIWLGPAFLTEADVAEASAYSTQDGEAVVGVQFDEKGTAALRKASRKQYELRPPRNEASIMTSGRVRATFPFREPIVGGSLEMHGFDSLREAEEFADELVGATPTAPG